MITANAFKTMWKNLCEESRQVSLCPRADSRKLMYARCKSHLCCKMSDDVESGKGQSSYPKSAVHKADSRLARLSADAKSTKALDSAQPQRTGIPMIRPVTGVGR